MLPHSSPPPIPGLYSGISTIFLRIKYHRTTNKKADKWKDTTFYALCALYILSVATFAIDITVFVIRGFEGEVVVSKELKLNLLF